jgi:hypothetical protein
LGDPAQVSSIAPPDGSAQSGHCARFYPMARDAIMEMHTWGFTQQRVSLALLAITPPSEWKYAYGTPTGVLNYLSILAADAADDNSVGMILPNDLYSSIPSVAVGSYTPQPFVVETLGGQDVLYTNQENAVLRYTANVVDPTQFSPLFTMALTMLLESMLAGPIIKGAEGRAAAKEIQEKFFTWWMAKATASDANQRRLTVAQRTTWIANR